MISSLQGKVLIKDEKFIVVDVKGVGYKVFLALSRISSLKKKEVFLFCSLRVKKDSWDLYGFLSLEELKLFDFLMNVPGIGPKAALEISSLGSLEKLEKAVKEDDKEIMEKLFNAGKKKAQAVIFELSREIKTKTSTDDEIIKPLSRLGFSRKEIKEALSNLSGKSQTAEERIKEALKILGK
jgi:holliday junction DNA helicase RuvA